MHKDERIKALKNHAMHRITAILDKDTITAQDETTLGNLWEKYLQYCDMLQKIDFEPNAEPRQPSTLPFAADIENEIEDATHYLALAQQHNSREFLSISKDSHRHAQMLLSMVQRRLHELNDAQITEYNEFVRRHTEFGETLKSTAI